MRMISFRHPSVRMALVCAFALSAAAGCRSKGGVTDPGAPGAVITGPTAFSLYDVGATVQLRGTLSDDLDDVMTYTEGTSGDNTFFWSSGIPC